MPLKSWLSDQTLLKIIKNSGYLLLGSLVGIAIALIRTPAEYGVIGGITLLASNINRLFSFRLSEVVVKYVGQALTREDRNRAAAVLKFSALLESSTALFSYIVLALIAGWASRVILKDASITPLVLFYGLMILANFMNETATGVLQVTEHFGSISVLNMVQSFASAVVIVWVLATGGGIGGILAGYLLGKIVQGVGSVILAWKYAKKELGAGWWRASFKALNDRKDIVRFAIHSNLSGTVNLVSRDSEILWANFFFSQEVAGYYKFAQAVMSFVSLPITPIIQTTFPQIGARVVRREWASIKQLLFRTSTLTFIWSAGCMAGMLLLGKTILVWMGDGKYMASFMPILILLLGYGVANTLFWNRPLLLAFGNAKFPLINNAIAGAIKVGLMFLLVEQFGMLVLPVLLAVYLAVTTLINSWKGYSLIGKIDMLSEDKGL